MEKSNELFLNKYYSKSMRVQGWDYASPAYYFVTICIKNGKPFFGQIRNNIMHLSEIGDIVLYNLITTPDHFKYTVLNKFSILPNHLHFIIQILWNDNPLYEKTKGDNCCFFCRDVACNVSTKKTTNISTKKPPMSNNNKNFYSQISPRPGSLSTIIRSFKSACTNQIRKSHLPLFQWQSKFYDHIIRNDFDLFRIPNYISTNPTKWEQDKNNKLGLWM